jgi:preprotein translocase subunit Sss1
MTDESMLSTTPYIRVLKLAAQPTTEEFSRIALITGAAALLIGTFGYLIFIVFGLLP